MEHDNQTWEEFATAHFSGGDADDARLVIHHCSTSPIARCLLQNRIFWEPLCRFRYICQPPTITSFVKYCVDFGQEFMFSLDIDRKDYYEFLATALVSLPGIDDVISVCDEQNDAKVSEESKRSLLTSLDEHNKKTVPEHHVLNMDDEHLTDCEIKSLCLLFPYLKHLKTLVLSCNDFSAEGALHVVQNLGFLTSLEELDLTENKIGDEGLSKIIPHIRHLYNLKVAESALCVNSGLRLLSLKLKDKAPSNIDNASSETFPPSYFLKLNCTRISDGGMVALAVNAGHLRHLTELDLGRNRIGDDGVAALANSFCYFSQLRVLILYINNIGCDGATALANGLRFLQHLRVLSLGANNIGDKAGAELARHFVYVPNLELLKLDHAGLSHKGIIAIAAQLPYLPFLKKLDLGKNKVGDLGARALAKVFPGLGQLQHLFLWDCGISSSGARDISSHLMYLVQLRQLHIANNNITLDSLQALATGFQATPLLSTVDLRGVRVPQDGKQTVESFYSFVQRLNGSASFYSGCEEDILSWQAALSGAGNLDYVRYHLGNGTNTKVVNDRLTILFSIHQDD